MVPFAHILHLTWSRIQDFSICSRYPGQNIPILGSNSKCCCNETPSTAGWSLDHIPQLQPWSQQACFLRKVCRAIYVLDTWRSSVCTAYAFWLASYIMYTLVTIACIADRVFSWNIFFPDFWHSAGKISRIGVQSLMAFPYSNICCFGIYTQMHHWDKWK